MMGPIRRLVKLTPILLICCLSNVVYSDHNATDHSVDEIIHISLMVSSAPTLNTVKVERSVAKVVENVNRDSTILPGFSLQHKALKTKVRLPYSNTCLIAIIVSLNILL